MAFAGGVTFEVQTGGNDTNGGGFNSAAAGTDYSLVATKRTATGTDDSTTDAVANGTTTITSATANFGTSIVGNVLYFSGGTGTLTGTRRMVSSRSNATTIIVDATVPAGTGITMNVGGALASLGGAGFNALVSGNTVWIKAGTYTIASATANINTGCFSKTTNIRVEGYNTSRGDLGTPPLLQASGISTFTIITMTSTSGPAVRNINFDGASLTSARGVQLRGSIYKCGFVNFTNTALTMTTGSAIYCSASGCTGNGFQNGNYFGCVAHTNSGRGFITSTANGVFVNCLSYGNTGANGNGFEFSGESAMAINCSTYNNANKGFTDTDENGAYINCVADDNTADGFEFSGSGYGAMYYCAAYSNSPDFDLGTDAFSTNTSSITGSASFLTAPGSGDLSLNNSNPGGAQLRGTGILGAFPLALTTGHQDIGAAQHQDTGGGGGAHSAVF